MCTHPMTKQVDIGPQLDNWKKNWSNFGCVNFFSKHRGKPFQYTLPCITNTEIQFLSKMVLIWEIFWKFKNVAIKLQLRPQIDILYFCSEFASPDRHMLIKNFNQLIHYYPAYLHQSTITGSNSSTSFCAPKNFSKTPVILPFALITTIT